MRKLLMMTLLVMLNLPAMGQGKQLGRLFTTPDERARLDAARERESLSSPAMEQINPSAMPDQATLDGYVIRKSGKNTTWINQVPKDEMNPTKSVQVTQRRNQAPAIFIQTEAGRHIKVGVGDTLDVRTGDVRKIYEPADVTATATTLPSKRF